VREAWDCAEVFFYTGAMILTRMRGKGVALLLFFAFLATPAFAFKLPLPADTPAILEKIYSFDLEGAIKDARRLQAEQPDHPLGYLLEAEALWWRMWCTSAEFKYGMNDARHRAKLEADQRYMQLAEKISSLAAARIKLHETAEMQFYAGTGDAMAARLYGLRGETRNVARAAVRGREHLLRAKMQDPDLADADAGLGLYNYYVDTLSSVARVLRFLMGIPGGSKQEGIRLLEHAISDGVLTSNDARFYLALNLHRYDQQYEKALRVISPLAEKYPSNPLFQLARGDLYAKLGRKDKALVCYRAAGTAKIQDAECEKHVRELVRVSIASLGGSVSEDNH
jgi:tetratricopeptide (TPR) repeat protein